MKLIILIYTKLVIVFVFCGCVRSPQPPHPGAINPTNAFALSQSEYNVLVNNVFEKQDAESAFKLAQYYQFIDLNINKEIYWFKKSAELGNVNAQYILAELYINNAKVRNVGEATYWLDMIAANKSINDAYFESLVQDLRNKKVNRTEPTKAR